MSVLQRPFWNGDPEELRELFALVKRDAAPRRGAPSGRISPAGNCGSTEFPYCHEAETSGRPPRRGSRAIRPNRHSSVSGSGCEMLTSTDDPRRARGLNSAATRRLSIPLRTTARISPASSSRFRTKNSNTSLPRALVSVRLRRRWQLPSASVMNPPRSVRIQHCSSGGVFIGVGETLRSDTRPIPPSTAPSHDASSRQSPFRSPTPGVYAPTCRMEPTPPPLTAEASRRAAAAWWADRPAEQMRACPWLQRW